jgi:TolB-like protein/DNA-binding SARP family transcriptional activator
MLRLHTFGCCFLDRDGSRLDGVSGQRKGLALLAVLAASGARGVSRETLLALLWPESDQERARLSLNQLVHALRQQVRTPDLLDTTAELRLNPAHVTSDVAAFREALHRGDPEAAVALYEGPFLDGFYVKGTDDFERWAATERAALARAAAGALEAVAKRASTEGNASAAVEWWRRLADAEPLSARAATGLMRALDAAGERPAALRHARVYERLVGDEVGGAPDPAVVDLAARLQRADVAAPGTATTAQGMMAPTGPAAPASSPPAAPAGRPSVAVLPFANTSGDPADEPFSDGLTDELIGVLGRVAGLMVTGRTSAFALRGRGLDVRAIAETLGVATVLEGSVRRAGARLKVTAQLVRASDSAVLWAEAFDRAHADVFTVQEEIARAIAGALRVQLGAEPGPRARPVDLAAYELYLRGRHLQNTRSDRAGMLQAARYLDQAVARDPAYARAYAALSDAHAMRAVYGHGRPDEEYAAAKPAALRALALDDSLAEAHAALGHVLFVYDYDWAAAEREFRQALALDPSYTWTHCVYAICLQDQGRFAEAGTVLEAARRVDPLAPFVSAVLGRVYVNARQPDQAIRALTEALELYPQFDFAYQQLGHAYLQQGRHDEALTALGRAAELSGARDAAHLAYAYAVAGQRAEAERIVRSLVEPGREPSVSPFHVAMAYAGLGDAAEAFRRLEQGYVERASFLDGVMVTPAFEPLHADPRWGRLLRRMNLAP